ncbi:MAG: hypothetical protein QOH06_4313 [Acidobacteriota bacterium]|jgi:hypothetical protein|nr:hypothetical protein [Acidobacteriota bacterium]
MDNNDDFEPIPSPLNDYTNEHAELVERRNKLVLENPDHPEIEGVDARLDKLGSKILNQGDSESVKWQPDKG